MIPLEAPLPAAAPRPAAQVPRLATRDDRVLPAVHGLAGLVPLVLLVAAAILYLFPDQTPTLFAWTIQPTMSALLMGAGYAAGAYYFARVFFGTRWHRVSLYFPAITAFTAVQGLNTILYWPNFHQGQIPFYAWVGLYFTTPFVLPWLWWRNQATDPGTPETADVLVPRGIRLGAGAAGVGLLALAALMVIRPEAILAGWPWALTPATCRAIGGWLAAPAVCDLLFAFEPRWSAWRIIVQHQALAVGLILLAVVRAWSEFNPASPATWLYVGGMAGFLLALLALLLYMDARRPQAAAPPHPVQPGIR